jgi:hypothetical protein
MTDDRSYVPLAVADSSCQCIWVSRRRHGRLRNLAWAGVLCVTPPGPQLPCHWLAPDAAVALPGLMPPAAAGLFMIPLAPVPPASVLLSVRLHPEVPITSSTTDAAIAMCFLVSFIAHSSGDCSEPGSGRRISSTMDSSRSSRKQQIACLTFNGIHRSWIVRNEAGASRIPAQSV